MMSMMTPSGSGSAEQGGSGGSYMSSMYGPSAYALKKDRLNLSGLLNVLDGVVDTPERIVVMTTNHPEILDPALIRPGRIEKKLFLGFMKSHNVVSMIEHYFQLGQNGLGAKLTQRVHRVIDGDEARGVAPLQLTPAQVEQLSAEHDGVEGMVAAIEGLGGLVDAGSEASSEASSYDEIEDVVAKPTSKPELRKQTSKTQTAG